MRAVVLLPFMCMGPALEKVCLQRPEHGLWREEWDDEIPGLARSMNKIISTVLSNY